jgi:protein required for attachment to host cells
MLHPGEKIMLTRIVVADQGEAHFYDAIGFAHPLKFVGSLANAAAHLRDQDLTSDRPGRVFKGSSVPGRRRGATLRHSTGGERTPRRHATHLFAHRIAAELELARRAGRFGRLVLIAAPAILGELRAALTPAVRPCVVSTVVKDVVHRRTSDLRRYLPRSTFTEPTGFVLARRA